MTGGEKRRAVTGRGKFEDPLTIASQSRDDPHGGSAGSARGITCYFDLEALEVRCLQCALSLPKVLYAMTLI